MKNDIKIEWLASLSKIKFSAEEIEKMSADMRSIMALMDSLSAVNPVSDETAAEYARLSDLRPDEVKPSFDPKLLTSQSKDSEDGCFVISKVL
ncbi:MAG: aspartyl/glutamyl-tRNA amidotransferase subunit C [Clostridiales bacterium]|jgi:aspartyl/glutamyl-tRNA(Asn/Gln) amidotransferase C subunit|nr:aspartyl/glutamyl-tRNA amidotransferase subunit C [Clostridiales bacterium]